MGANKITEVVIASGASVSAAINISERELVAVYMPSAWTTANLTVQVSRDSGSTYCDLFDLSGDEYTIPVAASRYVVATPVELYGADYIRLRSGTSGTPVTQGGARTLAVVTRPV